MEQSNVRLGCPARQGRAHGLQTFSDRDERSDCFSHNADRKRYVTRPKIVTNVIDVAEQLERERDTQRRGVMLPNLQVKIAQEKEIHALSWQVRGILELVEISRFLQARSLIRHPQILLTKRCRADLSSWLQNDH